MALLKWTDEENTELMRLHGSGVKRRRNLAAKIQVRPSKYPGGASACYARRGYKALPTTPTTPTRRSSAR